MIPRKLVETAFRLWWLIPIPVLLVPILVFAATREPARYTSQASVWVTRPDGVDPGTLARNSNPYLTPAQNQVRVLYDLLSTRTFRADVAVRAGLVEESAQQTTKEKVGSYYGQDLRFGAVGTNVMGIWASATTPEVAHTLATAVIEEYQERSSVEAERELGILREYYSGQLAPASATLELRQAALTEYLGLHPGAGTNLSNQPEYNRLSDDVAQQQEIVNGLKSALQELDLRSASTLQGQQAVFNLVDEPSVPITPEPVSRTTQLGYPLAGAMLGVIIAGAIIYLAYRTDHSIRSHEDLVGFPSPLLGYVPEVRPWLTPVFARRGYARRVATAISFQRADEGITP